MKLLHKYDASHCFIARNITSAKCLQYLPLPIRYLHENDRQLTGLDNSLLFLIDYNSFVSYKSRSASICPTYLQNLRYFRYFSAFFSPYIFMLPLLLTFSFFSFRLLLFKHSRILSIFGRIIAYLCKKIAHLNNIIQEESLYFVN